MGNPLPKNTYKGSIGELLVQLRLLELGIQAAPPIKDSGNDLIAIKGEIVKFIQVKTEYRLRNLPKVYHLIATVDLQYDKDKNLALDKSKVLILKKGESLKQRKELTRSLVNTIWRKIRSREYGNRFRKE